MIEERIENIDIALPNEKTVMIFGRTGETHYMGEYEIKTGRVVDEAYFTKDDEKYPMMMFAYSSAVMATAMASWADSAVKSLKEKPVRDKRKYDRRNN